MKFNTNNMMLSVGMKILLGVALTSAVCIGGLVYVFWQANERVEANVNEVLTIRQQDSSRLREAIVGLQDKMLSFTQYLKVNPENEIRIWFDSKFKLIEDGLGKQQNDTETIAQLVAATSQDTQDVSVHIQQVREDASKAKSISARVSADAEIISNQLTTLLSEATTRLQDIGQLEKAA